MTTNPTSELVEIGFETNLVFPGPENNNPDPGYLDDGYNYIMLDCLGLGLLT